MSTVLKPSIFSALLQRLRDGKALILLWVCILSLVYQCWNHLLQDIRLGLLFSWNSGKLLWEMTDVLAKIWRYGSYTHKIIKQTSKVSKDSVCVGCDKTLF